MKYIGVNHDGVDIYRGITYARYERWHEAVMTPASDEEVDATTWGTVCPQRPSRAAKFLDEDQYPKCEEGRLCLSVYAPEGAHDLPVMVWVHGGAFLTGGSEEHRYGGERLVRAGNVVVVKVSYRLGAFGYLYMPDKGIENLGLKDLRTAMAWIQREIATFGGNPDDVTIFAQSAGAQLVAALIATTDETPSWRKVILQSAPLGIGMSTKEASKIARKFCRVLGKDIYSATVEELLDAQGKCLGAKTGMAFMPVIPDYLNVPQSIVRNDVKFVVGYAADDASPFVMGYLGKLFGTSIGNKVVHAVTRRIFADASDRYVDKLRGLGLTVHKYFISWHPAGNPMGACHCIEMPFILGTHEDWVNARMLQGMTDEEFAANSEVCLRAWTTFANSGSFPGGGLLMVNQQ